MLRNAVKVRLLLAVATSPPALMIISSAAKVVAHREGKCAARCEGQSVAPTSIEGMPSVIAPVVVASEKSPPLMPVILPAVKLIADAFFMPLTLLGES